MHIQFFDRKNNNWNTVRKEVMLHITTSFINFSLFYNNRTRYKRLTLRSNQIYQKNYIL